MEVGYECNGGGDKFDFILNSLGFSLGDQTTVKCLCGDEGAEVKFTRCWAKIVDELVYSKGRNDAFLNLLNKIIQSFHERHVCSTKSAVAVAILMWKSLSRKLDALNEEHQSASVASCLDSVFSQALDRLLKSELVKRAPVMEVKLRSSGRHKVVCLDKNQEEVYKSLIYRLCRCQSLHSDLIWDVFQHNDYKISLERVTFIVDYSSGVSEDVNDQMCIIKSGIIFELNENQTLKHDYNTLIFDASLVYNYTHVGYNKDLKCAKFTKAAAATTTDQRSNWLSNLKEILIKHSINLLIVSGNVDKELQRFCVKEQIIVIMCLNAERLKAMKSLFDFATVLVYIEDFTESCVFKSAVESVGYKNYASVRRQDDSTNVTTVLIKKNNKKFLLRAQMKMFVEELKHNVKRFENVLNAQAYFVNTSAILENEFAKLITNSVCCANEDEVYFSLAKEILYETFFSYHTLVAYNTGKTCDVIYDDLSSKIEAWKLALYINKLILNIDYALLLK